MISYDELRDLALEQADDSPVAVRVVCTGKPHHLAVVKATPAGWLYQANTLFPPAQAALAREWLEDAKGGRHIDDPPLMHVSFLVLDGAGTPQRDELPESLPCWCSCGIRSVKREAVERRSLAHWASGSPQVLTVAAKRSRTAL